MSEAAEGLDSLCLALGHRFAKPELVVRALSHASLAGEESYERLEFLGDRVLGLVISQLLLERFPAENEGEIGRRFAALVQAETLTQIGTDIGIAGHALAAPGVLNDSIIADITEALIAALYLDGGMETADRFIRGAWEPLIEQESRPPRDAKTALQEWSQAEGRGLPHYADVARTGPDHKPEFTVEVQIDGLEAVGASGTSKRSAEQNAAAIMIARLGVKQDA